MSTVATGRRFPPTRTEDDKVGRDRQRFGADHTEQALDGGNVSDGVVRVGDTVRKPAGFWTPSVEALLAHLQMPQRRTTSSAISTPGAGRWSTAGEGRRGSA
jgi:hypothetical protein